MANIFSTPSSQLVADVSAASPNTATIPQLTMSLQPGGAREVRARITIGASSNVTAAFDVDLRLVFFDAAFEDTDLFGKSKGDTSGQRTETG